jgi:hypothetical protein
VIGSAIVPLQIAKWTDVHVCGKLAKSLIQVVHLREDTNDGDNDEHVCRGVRELVLALERHFQSNAKGFDGHDGDGSSRGADGQVNERVLSAVLGCDLVDHEDGKDGHKSAVHEKA